MINDVEADEELQLEVERKLIMELHFAQYTQTDSESFRLTVFNPYLHLNVNIWLWFYNKPRALQSL